MLGVCLEIIHQFNIWGQKQRMREVLKSSKSPMYMTEPRRLPVNDYLRTTAVRFPLRAESSLFATTSIPAVCLTQRSIRLLPDAPSRGRSSRKLHLLTAYLKPKFRMSKAIPTLPHTLSLRDVRQDDTTFVPIRLNSGSKFCLTTGVHPASCSLCTGDSCARVKVAGA